MALADYQLLVDDLVRDQGAVLSDDARDRAIGQAVLQYGSDLPRELVEDVVWVDAGPTGPMPAQWMPGAWIKGAEHPVGAQPPRPLELAVYFSANQQQLLSPWSLPAGAVVRVTYATRHGVSATQDTIDDMHRLPVAQLAASLLCMQLATHFSGQRETLVGADASSTETRAREYAARARDYRSAYYIGTGQIDPYKVKPGAGAGAGGSGAPAAGATVAWPGRRRERLGGSRP